MVDYITPMAVSCFADICIWDILWWTIFTPMAVARYADICIWDIFFCIEFSRSTNQ